jgi:glycosyltransferase involved in cell wall biosynthesis
MSQDEPKVAIVCDWLTSIGGAERVVYELHKLYPKAPIYTSQYDKSVLPWLENVDVRVGWLQTLPKSLRKFMPVFRAWYFSSLDLSEFDLVISSSGAEAKAIKTSGKTKHLCYCHSPTHYYWTRYYEYLKDPGFGKLLDPIARLGLKILVGPMRRWDIKAASRADLMIANSTYTQSQIKKYYRRDSIVVHPPVDIERFTSKNNAERNGFIIAGRQTPYKRFDLAVKAASDMKAKLTVVGKGPDHEKLKKIAGETISFITEVSDSDMPKLFKEASGFIFPGVDDFGIVAIEALAAGTPVIAYKDGGALDYIKPGENGEFFKDKTPKSLKSSLEKFDGESFNHSKVAATAKKYNIENFQKKIKTVVNVLEKS